MCCIPRTEGDRLERRQRGQPRTLQLGLELERSTVEQLGLGLEHSTLERELVLSTVERRQLVHSKLGLLELVHSKIVELVRSIERALELELELEQRVHSIVLELGLLQLGGTCFVSPSTRRHRR